MARALSKPVSAASLDQRPTQCFAENRCPCAALEYITDTGNREIHSDPITQLDKAEGVPCQVAEWAAHWREALESTELAPRRR